MCRFGARLHSGTEEVYQTEVKSDNGAILGTFSNHILSKYIQVIALEKCLESAPASAQWSRTVPTAQRGPIL